MYLRQSTTQTIRFGPFLDITDGVAEEIALTITQALMRLSKDGGAFAQKNAAGNATHDSDGWYSTALNATDTATVGELILNVQIPATALPVWMRFWVIEEAVYDLYFGAAATGLVTLAAVTHTGAVIPTVTTLTGHTAQTGDSFVRIGAAGAGLTNINLPNQTMDIVGNITGNLTGSVGSVTGAVGSVTGAVGSVTAAVTVGTINANALNAAAIATNAFTAVKFAASSLNGKGDWNIGKTGYSLTQAFPTNFADLAIVVTTGLVSVGSLAANAITATSIATNAFTAAKFAAASLNGKGDWNIGKTGYSLTQAFPTNFADLAVTITTGRVDINVNNDKTGYSVSALSANVITAASINAAALNGKGDWNIGKTGYSLTQAFPTNFADLSITVTTGRIDLALWLGSAPNALVASRVDSSTGAMAANVITAAAINNAAITAAKFAANAITSTVIAANAITSSQLATDSIGAAQIAANAIGASELATDAIGAAQLATDAVDEIRDGLLPTQNVAFSNIEFLWVAASDHVTPVTGASTTSVTRSIDGGGFVGAGGTLAEVGNGIYQFDASSADMNGGIITFRFVATGGTPGAPDDAFVTIVTGGGV